MSRTHSALPANRVEADALFRRVPEDEDEEEDDEKKRGEDEEDGEENDDEGEGYSE